MRFRIFVVAAIASGLALASAEAAEAIPPVKTAAPAATYTLDKTHASLIFRVNHLGLSRYTARFTRVDATLVIDPANPTAAKLTATVDPRSLETDFPLAQPDFDAELQGPKFLDAARYPEIAFRATGIELTGPSTARLTGDLTLHGVTKPVAMDVVFNGGYAGIPGGPPEARIGFSAAGTLKRSDFGISYGIPAPGTMLGVGDEVEFMLEVEFIGPPAAGSP